MGSYYLCIQSPAKAIYVSFNMSQQSQFQSQAQQGQSQPQAQQQR